MGAFPVDRGLAEFGRSSLFVYWVHVELAYGVVSIPLHRSLTLEEALLGVILLSLLMYALVQAEGAIHGFKQAMVVAITDQARLPCRLRA